MHTPPVQAEGCRSCAAGVMLWGCVRRRACEAAQQYREAKAARDRLRELRTQQAEMVLANVRQRHASELALVRGTLLAQRERHGVECAERAYSPQREQSRLASGETAVEATRSTEPVPTWALDIVYLHCQRHGAGGSG